MPNLLKRTLYLGYYLKETDLGRLRAFASHVVRDRRVSRAALYGDVLRSVYRHNVAPLDYFYFRFHDKPESERSSWAGTGYMYEYQLAMNPPGSREVLADKVRFLEHFRRFVRRPFASLETLRNNLQAARMLLEEPSGRVVIKDSTGQCGQEVAVLPTAGMTRDGLLRTMIDGGYDLAEGYVVQHPDLMRLSPSGLNTVRVFTQLAPSGEVQLLGARLRITVNSPVDNLAAGNIAAPIDLETGVLTGPGVHSDITKADLDVHPVTGVAITGFQIPFWRETLDQVSAAARLTPENRSIGWDVAIGPEGPELIEGNHNWCKLLWQLPVKQGLKHMLEQHR
jgi:hypothetical protein